MRRHSWNARFSSPGAATMTLVAALVAGVAGGADAQATKPIRATLAPARVEGRWVQPDVDAPNAEPMWGHADGIRVGIQPLGGPRGLLRIYTPYLHQPPRRLINFIAVEPIVQGERFRGLSELEHSRLDNVAGKRFWSVADPTDSTPRDVNPPVRGEVRREDGVETLVTYVQVERFDNGAHVYLRLRFRADRPHEVGIAAFALPDSKPLANCVLSATMGNYARLRELHLADRTVTASDVFPDHRGDGFTDHARFGLDLLTRTPAGGVIVTATPDEADPVNATYAPGTGNGWRYVGDVATQYWRDEMPDAKLEARVNGRATYWASQSPIPGGVAFENFELFAPFRSGGEFWFGVEPGRVEPRALAGIKAEGSAPALK